MYARAECGIHEQVSNHANIVKLYDHGETDNEFQMYMEYCDKADSLTEKIRDVSCVINLAVRLSSDILFYYTPKKNDVVVLSIW